MIFAGLLHQVESAADSLGKAAREAAEQACRDAERLQAD